jgi:AcrR family transcriptional regulator
MTVVELGRRERKKLETRRALARAALHLAVEKGVDQITIDEIAEAADVSVRTFFNYFPSKEAAVVAWDRERMADVHAQLRERPADEPPLESLRLILRSAFDEYAEDRETRLLRNQVVQQNPSLLPYHLAALGELERGFAEAVAERLGVDAATDMYPYLVVSAAVAAMRQTFTRWEQSGRTVPMPTLMDQAFEVLARGFAPPSPARRRTKAVDA